jgi:hypothetical protein
MVVVVTKLLMIVGQSYYYYSDGGHLDTERNTTQRNDTGPSVT